MGEATIVENEETTVEITNEDVEEVRQKGEFCLVGKIGMDRTIGKPVIETELGKIWRLQRLSNLV